jgi:hypothetical protein
MSSRQAWTIARRVRVFWLILPPSFVLVNLLDESLLA